jgi:hypothetical protein
MSAMIPGTEVPALARAAYEAFTASMASPTLQPDFDALPQYIIDAWIAATVKVCEMYGAQIGHQE